MADEAEKQGQWVGEIEFRIASRLLQEGAGIVLDNTTRRIAKLPSTRDGMPLITLYNPNESHYEYYSFFVVAPAKRRRSRKVGRGRSTRKRTH